VLVPSGRLALVADEVSGPERRCREATDDELVGLLRVKPDQRRGKQPILPAASP
jgi:hypothetical protein